jgi:hypothetical protein
VAKKPLATAPVAPSKKPAAVRDPDIIKHQPISWGFGWVDFEGEHGWRTFDVSRIETLHDELTKFEGRTFFDLEQSKKIKDIPVEHLNRQPRERLKELRLDEVEVLWELRLPKKWRAWGLVEKAIFYFLWWDEKETVCHAPPKGKKRR